MAKAAVTADQIPPTLRRPPGRGGRQDSRYTRVRSRPRSVLTPRRSAALPVTRSGTSRPAESLSTAQRSGMAASGPSTSRIESTGSPDPRACCARSMYIGCRHPARPPTRSNVPDICARRFVIRGFVGPAPPRSFPKANGTATSVRPPGGPLQYAASRSRLDVPPRSANTSAVGSVLTSPTRRRRRRRPFPGRRARMPHPELDDMSVPAHDDLAVGGLDPSVTFGYACGLDATSPSQPAACPSSAADATDDPRPVGRAGVDDDDLEDGHQLRPASSNVVIALPRSAADNGPFNEASNALDFLHLASRRYIGPKPRWPVPF